MKNENSLLVNKKKQQLLIVTGIVLLVCIIFSIYTYSNLLINKNEIFIKNPVLINIVYVLVCSIITIAITSISIFIQKLEKMQFYKKFFFIALILGTLYLVVSPMFNGSDEVVHFLRAYEISQGKLMTEKLENGSYGSYMPKSIAECTESKYDDVAIRYPDIKHKLRISLDQENVKIENGYVNASLYSPVQYIPYSIAMFFGNLFGLSPYILGMLGRIFGFAFWLFICTISIKIIPNKKLFLALIFLLPSSIIGATTISGDMMTNCSIALFLSIIYKFIIDKKKLTKGYIITLVILATMIGLCKIVYVPIILLIFLIPKECIDNKNKKYYFLLTFIIVIAVGISLLWLALASGYIASMSEQKDWILSHPISYAIVMFRTIINEFGKLIMEIVGGKSLYQARVMIPDIISYIMLVYVGISLFCENHKKQLKNIQKIIVTGILISVIVLILTALYVQATAMIASIGNPIIVGLQGRYFIPPLILLMFLIDKKYLNMNYENIEKSALIGFIIMHSFVLINVLYTFII